MSESYVYEFELDVLDIKKFRPIFDKQLETDDFCAHWDDLYLDIGPEGAAVHIQENCRATGIDFDLLTEFLKPYVQGSIYVRDDYGEKWRYHFPGDGTCEEQGVTEFYAFDAYDVFVEEYGEQLPKKLLEDLKKWRIATKV